MKRIFLIGLLTITASVWLFSQSINKHDEMDADYSNRNELNNKSTHNSSKYQYQDTIISPDNNFKIIIKRIELADAVLESQFTLIRTKQKDTTVLLTTKSHDLPPHNFFWASNNQLIYENSSDYRQNCNIEILDLQNKTTEFSTPGSIPVTSRYRHKFYDRKNNVFIYFVSGTKQNAYKPVLMKLEVKTKSVQKLMTFYTSFEYEFPIVELDCKSRILRVKYRDDITGKEYQKELVY